MLPCLKEGPWIAPTEAATRESLAGRGGIITIPLILPTGTRATGVQEMDQGGVEHRAKGFDLFPPPLAKSGPTSGEVSNAYVPGPFTGTRSARFLTQMPEVLFQSRGFEI